MASTGDVAALQAALAAENAAIFGYGVAGAHLTGSSQAAAEQDWTGHNQARDALAVGLRDLGFELRTQYEDGVARIGFDLYPGARVVEAMDERERAADAVSLRAILAPRSVARPPTMAPHATLAMTAISSRLWHATSPSSTRAM